MFLGIALLLGGLAAMSGVLWLHARQLAVVKSFVEVEAVVLNSQVLKSEEDRERESTYSPLIRYRYVVEGKSYKSERFAFHYSMDEKQVEREVAARPVGSTTKAYYDPLDPGASVLHRGPGSIAGLLTFSILIALSGVGMVIGSFKINAGHEREAKVSALLVENRDKRSRKSP